MKKLTKHEMKVINGGAQYYVVEETCSGIHKNLKKRHDTLITGKDPDKIQAIIKYNTLLDNHKNSTYYRDYNHNQNRKPLN